MQAASNQGGHVVGELCGDKLLVEYQGLSPHRHHLWLYKCSCGVISGPATLAHIKRHLLCANCRIGESNAHYKGYKQITGVFLGSYKHGAQRRGLEWGVTSQYLWSLWEKQQGRCYYTDIPLTLLVKKWSEADASIDRIDNNLGYVEGNIAWVHKDINRLKSDFTEERFLYLCKLVST